MEFLKQIINLLTCLAKSSWTERFSMVSHRSGALAVGRTIQVINDCSQNLGKTKKERRWENEVYHKQAHFIYTEAQLNI
jgi:hypothetical protein